MKVLNVVLSVLILLLAVVSAVSSYLLFEKRGELLGGWKKMAAAVGRTATAMDRGSGTSVGSELTAEALDHKQYASLDGQLEKLVKQAEKLVAERDALASAIMRAGEIFEMSGLPPEKAFTEVATSNASRDKVMTGLVDFKNRRDRMIRDLCATTVKIGMDLKPDDFKKDGGDAAMRKFDGRVDALKAQFAAYQKSVAAVASLIGAPAPDLSDAAYATSLVNVVDAVRDMKTKLDASLVAIEQLKNQLAANRDIVKQRDSQIGALKVTIDGKEGEIVQLRKALGLDPAVEFKPWLPGSKESRRAVRGRVVEVNDKFGFVAVNLGKNTQVRQVIGDKEATVNPQIESGMEMVVARRMDTKDVEFIGKIRLTAVDDDCSVGEPHDLSPESKIEVGDQVYFQDADDAAQEKADSAQPAAKQE